MLWLLQRIQGEGGPCSKKYKTEAIEEDENTMSVGARLSTHLMLSLVLMAISAVLSSMDTLTDQQVLKREIFIQKLAARMEGKTRWVEK